MYSLGNILKVKSMELIYWLYTISNFSGVISLVQGCDTVLGYSDKNVNEFKVGFDAKNVLSFTVKYNEVFKYDRINGLPLGGLTHICLKW